MKLTNKMNNNMKKRDFWLKKKKLSILEINS